MVQQPSNRSSLPPDSVPNPESAPARTPKIPLGTTQLSGPSPRRQAPISIPPQQRPAPPPKPPTTLGPQRPTQPFGKTQAHPPRQQPPNTRPNTRPQTGYRPRTGQTPPPGRPRTVAPQGRTGGSSLYDQRRPQQAARPQMRPARPIAPFPSKVSNERPVRKEILTAVGAIIFLILFIYWLLYSFGFGQVLPYSFRF